VLELVLEVEVLEELLVLLEVLLLELLVIN